MGAGLEKAHAVHPNGADHGAVETAAGNQRDGGGHEKNGGRSTEATGTDLGIDSDEHAGKQIADDIRAAQIEKDQVAAPGQKTAQCTPEKIFAPHIKNQRKAK